MIPATENLDGGHPLLSVRGLTKRYGGLLALDRVDLDVRRGGFWRWSATTGPASLR